MYGNLKSMSIFLCDRVLRQMKYEDMWGGEKKDVEKKEEISKQINKQGWRARQYLA